ncbi:hypothetical protein DACRYDRAFT_105828 [Dacryopinax primogenitus]|uniref:Uncharacterized protein n=1 Tax=Dacryopinax primogenitus (strain DJM 731) TaxID=1858805 RepID=M5G085_DACPD|nr:uncharacterized protein DACRYDRAFT_105828 [Dacryopinax primogenitus]EJU03666.1 hypothetical protein DACRYDRAFT_105828 [Dacryopinax primogenitus]
MSLGEADAKFPGQGGNGLPPPKTAENPGQVYPKSDPQIAPSSTHYDRPLPSSEPTHAGPPPPEPSKTTSAVPGTGGAVGTGRMIVKDALEEAENPAVDQERGGGFQNE